MEPNEASARRVARLLTDAGLAPRVDGAGVHWAVEIEGASSRSVSIACFWYDAPLSGLALGMNPANDRQTLGRRDVRRRRTGDEFLVQLREDSKRVVDGRTPTETDAVSATRAWLSGAAVDSLAREVPFIDATGRAMRTLASQLDPHLRFLIAGDPTYELWSFQGNRRCRVTLEDASHVCSFFIGRAQVARAHNPDIRLATGAWLLDRRSLAELADRVPDVEIEPDVNLMLKDPARWHWSHLLKRVADPADPLAPMREFVELLSLGLAATRFFTFSSLNSLCFSASSHYPWVTDGLPTVWRTREGSFAVTEEKRPGRDVPCFDLVAAAARIEEALAQSPHSPFFGDAADSAFRIMNETVATLGHRLRVELVFRLGGWQDVVLRGTVVGRHAQVDYRDRLTFNLRLVETGRRVDVDGISAAEVASVASSFCEGAVSFEDIMRDRGGREPPKW